MGADVYSEVVGAGALKVGSYLFWGGAASQSSLTVVTFSGRFSGCKGKKRASLLIGRGANPPKRDGCWGVWGGRFQSSPLALTRGEDWKGSSCR